MVLVLRRRNDVPGHDIVVVGASAGGLDAVSRLVRVFPSDMPAAVFVVIHVAPSATSALASILDRAGPLPASQAVDGEAIELSRIYVASPNRHLLIKEGSVAVAVGPRENRHRPAIDTLFRTAARVYGARVIGVVLSGCGDDGVAGLRAIHDRGGVTIVQDPAEASFSDLPRNALAFATVDHTAPVADIAPLVARIVETPARAPVRAAPSGVGGPGEWSSHGLYS